MVAIIELIAHLVHCLVIVEHTPAEVTVEKHFLGAGTCWLRNKISDFVRWIITWKCLIKSWSKQVEGLTTPALSIHHIIVVELANFSFDLSSLIQSKVFVVCHDVDHTLQVSDCFDWLWFWLALVFLRFKGIVLIWIWEVRAHLHLHFTLCYFEVLFISELLLAILSHLQDDKSYFDHKHLNGCNVELVAKSNVD